MEDMFLMLLLLFTLTASGQQMGIIEADTPSRQWKEQSQGRGQGKRTVIVSTKAVVEAKAMVRTGNFSSDQPDYGSSSTTLSIKFGGE